MDPKETTPPVPALTAAPSAKVKTGTKKKSMKRPSVKPTIVDWKLQLTQIVLPAKWNRDTLGSVGDLVSSMKALNTQLQPALVRTTSDPKKFELVDGRRRFAALQELGWKTIRCTLDTGRRTKTRELHSIAANAVRRGNTPLEEARVFDSLVKDARMTNADIAAACGCTEGHVSQRRAILRAPAALITALTEGVIVPSVFRHLSRVDNDEDRSFHERMVAQTLKGTPAVTIGERIDNYLAKKTEKAVNKGETLAKRGGAAHKKNGPELVIRDYVGDKELRKTVVMVNKTTALDLMQSTAEKLRGAVSKDRRTYYQGIIDGMEELSGLIEYAAE